jgi:Ca-activated chloride channel family protein
VSYGLDQPAWLCALLLPAGLLAWRRLRPAPAVAFPLAARLGDTWGRATWRTRLTFLPTSLVVLAMACLCVALARPVERVPIAAERLAREVLLIVDASSSMGARDLDPDRTRLELVQVAASRFIAARGADRVGLLRFARYPDLISPPTADHGALVELLNEIETSAPNSPEDRTALGAAVARAAQVLAHERTERGAGTLVLLTDGEENVAGQGDPAAIDLEEAGAFCERLGLVVHTIAAGRGRLDARGLWQPLETAGLEALAERTGGRFFRAQERDSLDAVYRAIDQLEARALREPRTEVRERYRPWLGLAWGALLLAGLLRRGPLEVRP